MPTSIKQYICRHPRYTVIGDIVVQVTRPGNEPAELSGEAVNISRAGVRFITSEPLCQGERVTLQIEHAKSKVQINVPAEVRWSNELVDGRSDVGCKLDFEICWEDLGELFLNDAICPDE